MEIILRLPNSLKPVGDAVVQLLGTMDRAAQLGGGESIFTQMEMEIDHSEWQRKKAPAATKMYRAILPDSAKLPDGTFDMNAVKTFVEGNMVKLGPLMAITYQEIVDATLRGKAATEPAIRAKRGMKAGTSQRNVGELGSRNYGFIEAIDYDPALAE